MTVTRNETSEIRVLPPEEARRIAAGEVIDRPAALVREFLDNALDADGTVIEVIIEDGGVSRTEVVDNGRGMGRADLERCWLAHATSKIRSLDDLQKTATLGFRGEALAAAAAVARLEILSSRDGREAWKLGVGPGNRAAVLEQDRRAPGTSVRALGLFDTIPARKRFLKRSGSEAAACRQIFNEKAMAFPDTAFRFTQDGKLKTYLPPVSSFRERFIQIFLEEREGAFLHEINVTGPGFTVSVLAGGPELSRKDRRLQYVFANGRRIQDFALIQALEYGLEGWFPNGTHPLGALFVTVDPALADFNIHPAKREVRFADPGAIHHMIGSTLRDFSRRGMIPGDRKKVIAGKPADAASGALALEALLADPPEFAPLPGRSGSAGGRYPPNDYSPGIPGPGGTNGFEPGRDVPLSLAAENSPVYTGNAAASGEGETRYLGRLFGLFILVQKDDRLFIIDQHAAHERILYERFIAGTVPKQELLVTIPFSTDSSGDDRFLEEKRDELAGLGVVIRKAAAGEWFIEALPAAWKLSDRETVKEILGLKTAGGSLTERWAATLSCHEAVKDGDFLDERSALALAEAALALPVPRCPHGRPIWFEISRQDLFRAVKRT